MSFDETTHPTIMRGGVLRMGPSMCLRAYAQIDIATLSFLCYTKSLMLQFFTDVSRQQANIFGLLL